MNIETYQELAERTIPKEQSQNDLLINFSFGLIGESGELIDHLKKVFFHGHRGNKEYVTKELGDILWYVSGLASMFDIELRDVANVNIEKLARRYPSGYSSDMSVNRSEYAQEEGTPA